MSPARRSRLLALAVPAALLLAWEGAKALFALPAYQLPHVHEVLAELVRPSGGGHPWIVEAARNAAWTAAEALAGFVLGGALGLALALFLARWPLLRRGLLPYVLLSQTVPILAIAPMVVLWLGTTWVSKAVIAAYLTFFPVTMHVLRGFDTVDPDAVALMRAVAATPRQVFWKLRLPATLPYLFTALRLSATASVVGAIIGELPVGSRFGLGVVLINAAQYYTFRPATLWAAILVSALLGLVFYQGVVVAERWCLRGRPVAVPS